MGAGPPACHQDAGPSVCHPDPAAAAVTADEIELPAGGSGTGTPSC